MEGVGGGALRLPYSGEYAHGRMSSAQAEYRFPSGTVYRGAHITHPSVQVRHAQRVRVSPMGDVAIPLEIDGEGDAQLPATFTLLPKSLRLLV